MGSISSLITDFSHLEGVSVSAKQLKDIVVCISIDGEIGPCLKAALDCSSLVSLSLPALTGLPWWLRQYRICLQCRRPRFDPWVRKIAWRRKWQPTPVVLPGESHG